MTSNPDRLRLKTEPKSFSSSGWKAIMVIFASVSGVIAAGFASLVMAISLFGLHAFRVPSASMCPTVCVNQRLLASMDSP
jgi:signal peptidase I